MRTIKLAYDVVYPDGDTQRNLPPIILLHGMMDSRKTWRAIAPKIAKETGRIVYACDARNHGDSEWSDDFNFEFMAGDLERFMDEMEIFKAILMGHSMGGKTAMTLALNKPQRVEKLIVEDMGVRNWRVRPGSVNFVAQFLDLMRNSLESIPEGATLNDAQKAIIDFVKQFVPPSFAYIFDPSVLPLKQTEDGRYVWQANLDLLEDVLGNLDRLAQKFTSVYMGDALFVYGTKSIFKVDRDTFISQLFPKSQMVPIEGASHLLHTERPEEFLRHVVDFILAPQPLQSRY